MQAKHVDETESAPSIGVVASVRRYRRILLVVIAIVVVSGALYWGLVQYRSEPTAMVGSRTITLEEVSTSATRERGLSGRDGLPDDRGMLFIFDKPGRYCFWMKDMRFPIDMIWLDADKRVVKIEKNVQPATYPHSFCPDQPVDSVLEVAAGIADKAGLKVGDQVRTRSGLVL